MFEQSKWITAQNGNTEVFPAFCMRVSFEKGIRKAEISVSAAGLYKLFVNGTERTDGLFRPGWTQYSKRIQYQTYDITDLLTGENEIRITTGAGWALADLRRAGDHFFSDRICVIADLRIIFDDGSTAAYGSDENWDVYDSQLRSCHHYHGELNDYSYTPKLIGKAEPIDIASRLVPQEGKSVVENERVAVKKLIITPNGERVLDFGQNLAGYVEIRVKGKRGDRIRIRHAEILDTDGNFYVKNLRTARQTVEYVLGSGEEYILKPQFTFQGFRYICIDEFPGEIDIKNFTSVSLYTEMKRTGFFSCGNEKVNRLVDSIVWTQRSNSIDVPTDCPQRDERLGWLGDAELFCPTAAFNYDVYDFYAKWLEDIALSQRDDGAIRASIPFNPDANPAEPAAGWSEAIIIIPYEMYKIYGDPGLIRKYFGNMCRWIDFVRSIGPEEYLWLDQFQYGDWLALDGPNPRDPLTDKNFSSSAFFAYTTRLLIECGKIIGEDVSKYEELYRSVLKAFRSRFLVNGMPTTDTMTACILLLKFGLLEEAEKPPVIKHLIELIGKFDNKVCTGLYGTTYMLPVLSEYGYTKLAYDLLLEEGSPSWLGMITHGGTTIWERLDIVTDEGLKDVFNASFNHYVFGAVEEWLVKGAAGLDIAKDGPGCRKLIWKPLADERLGHVNIEFDSRSGLIRAGWQIFGDEVRYEISLPDGVEADISLPGDNSYHVTGGNYTFVLPAE